MMTKPTAELACRDMVTGLRITVDGSVQKVEMPKKRDPCCCPLTWHYVHAGVVASAN
jgi:hypothetical protein